MLDDLKRAFRRADGVVACEEHAIAAFVRRVARRELLVGSPVTRYHSIVGHVVWCNTCMSQRDTEFIVVFKDGSGIRRWEFQP